MKAKIIWICFALLVLLQLWVPVSLVWSREQALTDGKTFIFKTAPVDPTDYLRGKYVTLNFSEQSIVLSGDHTWEQDEKIFVGLTTDAAGFARIKRISNKKPSNGEDYVEARAGYTNYETPKRLNIEWPFERFYMEESKAPAAEQAYNRAGRDSAATAYALVKVKKGVAVLADVFINGKPIDEFIKE